MIIKGKSACIVSECESMQSELNERENGSFICDEHLDIEVAGFRSMAHEAMSDLDIPEDEQEQLLDDYVYQV